MIRAIRIRLYPTPDQKKYLAGLFGAVRYCYNKALYLKTLFYKVKGVNLHPIHDLKKLIAIEGLTFCPQHSRRRGSLRLRRPCSRCRRLFRRGL